MSSFQYLRDLITERLTAAAEEIFTAFEQTIAEYEEEVDRQRKLLEIVYKPRLQLQRIDPQQLVFKEEGVLIRQQFWNQERNSSLDQEEPESLQIKEEQEEICTSHKGEQLEVKQEADTLMLTLDNEESNHMEPEPDIDQRLLSHSSAVTESQDQTGSNHVDSVSNRDTELKTHKRSNRNKVDKYLTSKTRSKCHTAKKSCRCDTCGQYFAHMSRLILHVRGHTGEKPYSCNTCGKCFTNKTTLAIHMRTHTGEKPFSCETCGQRFGQSSTLIKHRRVHTDEKPYSCETCGQCFRERSNLKVHMRVHTGEKPFSCEICGKCFPRRSNLNVHIRIHTGEKPYSCETCGKCYGQLATLIRHKSTHVNKDKNVYLQQF